MNCNPQLPPNWIRRGWAELREKQHDQVFGRRNEERGGRSAAPVKFASGTKSLRDRGIKKHRETEPKANSICSRLRSASVIETGQVFSARQVVAGHEAQRARAQNSHAVQAASASAR